MLYDQWPFCLVAMGKFESRKVVENQQGKQGKKTLLHTLKKKKPFCTPSRKEHCVTHQQGKKTVELVSCLAM